MWWIAGSTSPRPRGFRSPLPVHAVAGLAPLTGLRSRFQRGEILVAASRAKRGRTGHTRRRFGGLGLLAELEWVVVLVIAPLLLFPSIRPRWTAAGLGVLVALWLLRWSLWREPWPVTPFNGALVLLALTIPVGIWASALAELTLPKATGLILGLATFRAVTLAVRDRPTFVLALAAFCLSGLLVIAVGAVAAQWLNKVAALGMLTRRIPRLITSLPDLRASGVHPNMIAGVLTLYLPVFSALVAWRVPGRSIVSRLLLLAVYVVTTLLVAGMLVLTQSRSGWIGGAAGLLTLWALWGLSGSHRWMRAMGLTVVLLVCVAVVGAGLYLGPQQVWQVVYEAQSDAPVEAMVGSISMAGRVEIWNRALYVIRDVPFTGCGLGTFRRIVRAFYPLFLTPPDYDIAHAHNTFLQIALDLGLPGLAAYLALLVAAGASCWRWARHGGPLARSVALGVAAGLAGLHVFGLTDTLSLGSKPGVAFWLALAVVASLGRAEKLEAPIERSPLNMDEMETRIGAVCVDPGP